MLSQSLFKYVMSQAILNFAMCSKDLMDISSTFQFTVVPPAPNISSKSHGHFAGTLLSSHYYILCRPSQATSNKTRNWAMAPPKVLKKHHNPLAGYVCPLLHSLQWKGSSCLRFQRLQAWAYGFGIKIVSASQTNIQPSEAPVVNCSTRDCPVAPFWATIAAIATMAWSWWFQ